MQQKGSENVKTYKKLYSVKYENILAMIYLPYMIINLFKANQDMFLIAIAMHLILSLGLYYSVRIARKEALQEIKQGIYEPLVDLEEISEDIKQLVRNIDKLKKGIKKEVTNTQYTNRQTYILKKSF